MLKRHLPLFAERFLSYATVRELKVHGAPSEAARALLDGFGASYLHPFEGFVGLCQMPCRYFGSISMRDAS
jgi:hypothetical protein